jgi:hypothetical protein
MHLAMSIPNAMNIDPTGIAITVAFIHHANGSSGIHLIADIISRIPVYGSLAISNSTAA